MKIFVSYAHLNHREAKRLVTDLLEADFEVWWDKKLIGGQRWWDEICRQIRNADIVICAISDLMLKSDACKSEYTYANKLDKTILPVKISKVDDKNLPYILTQIQYIDYSERNMEAFNEIWTSLSSLPISPLPKKLPKQPNMPGDPLVKLRDRIQQIKITHDEQHLILVELDHYLHNLKYVKKAMFLIKELRRHRDLLASIDQQLSKLEGEFNKIIVMKDKNILPEIGTVISSHPGNINDINYTKALLSIPAGTVSIIAFSAAAAAVAPLAMFATASMFIWSIWNHETASTESRAELILTDETITIVNLRKKRNFIRCSLAAISQIEIAEDKYIAFQITGIKEIVKFKPQEDVETVLNRISDAKNALEIISNLY